MRVIRAIGFAILGASMFAPARPGFATVVINEFVKDERTATTGTVSNDPREFVELYNAGAEAVDISGWTLTTQRVDGTATPTVITPGIIWGTDTINNGTILQPGEFFVMGRQLFLDTLPPGVKKQNVDFASELYEDTRATIMELRRGPYVAGEGNSPIEDAIGYDMYRAKLTPQPGVTFYTPTAEQVAQMGIGIWGQIASYNITETADFKRLSMGRYEDGVDSNRNGRDFRILPITPGTTNEVLPSNTAHDVPTIESQGLWTDVTGYNYGFKPAKVIDPSQVGPLATDPDGAGPLPAPSIHPSTINTTTYPIPGGRTKAIHVFDETGGGDVAYSKEYVTKFDIDAFLNTAPLGIAASPTPDWEAEWTAYGIGTTEPLFNTMNPHNQIPTGANATVTLGSQMGIGWVYERFQERPAEGTDNFFKLSLVDFGDGGNSVQSQPTTEWTIIQTFNLTGSDTGWHHLGIEFDKITGQGVATFDDQTVPFTIEAGLVGTFFAAYREGLSGVPVTTTNNFVNKIRAATFVEHLAAPELVGDYTKDGVVDVRDYVMWRKQNPGGMSSTQSYLDWRNNFGDSQSGSGGDGDTGGVPEPGTIALLLVGLAGVALRSRRGR